MVGFGSSLLSVFFLPLFFAFPLEGHAFCESGLPSPSPIDSIVLDFDSFLSASFDGLGLRLPRFLCIAFLIRIKVKLYTYEPHAKPLKAASSSTNANIHSGTRSRVSTVHKIYL